MLFLDPEARGQGLGARLLCLGMEQYGVSELTVNEQNPRQSVFTGTWALPYTAAVSWMNRAARTRFCICGGGKARSVLPYGARAKILSILMACRPVSCYTVFIYL